MTLDLEFLYLPSPPHPIRWSDHPPTHHVIYTRSQTSYSINSSPRSPLEHFNGVIIDGPIVDLRNKLTAKRWRRRWWLAVYGIIDLMCCTSRWCRRNKALEHRGYRIASCKPCRRVRRWGIRSREQLERHRKLKWDERTNFAQTSIKRDVDEFCSPFCVVFRQRVGVMFKETMWSVGGCVLQLIIPMENELKGSAHLGSYALLQW